MSEGVERLMSELRELGRLKESAGETRRLAELLCPKEMSEFELAMGAARVQYLAEKEGLSYEEALRKLVGSLEEIVQEDGTG